MCDKTFLSVTLHAQLFVSNIVYNLFTKHKLVRFTENRAINRRIKNSIEVASNSVSISSRIFPWVPAVDLIKSHSHDGRSAACYMREFFGVKTRLTRDHRSANCCAARDFSAFNVINKMNEWTQKTFAQKSSFESRLKSSSWCRSSSSSYDAERWITIDLKQPALLCLSVSSEWSRGKREKTFRCA